jgi:predicted PurR-regulated permease PerM
VSLYRFLRTSALLTVASRYRQKLFRLLVACAVAMVTSWLYDDINKYLEAQRPELVLMALVLKTLIVYGVLVYVISQLRPGAWSMGSDLPSNSSGSETRIDSPSPLDQLMDKPKLKTRKNSLLDEEPPGD